MREVFIFFNKKLAGKLVEESPSSYVFDYDKAYLLDSKNPSIAYEFPKNQTRFCSTKLFPFFANLLPEGNNKRVVCQTKKIDEDDLFGLLITMSGADTIGAVSVKKELQ